MNLIIHTYNRDYQTLTNRLTTILLKLHLSNWREENGRETLFRCKKREQKHEVVEMYRCRNDARKFYQKFKRLTEGYKPGVSSCKDEHGNLITDPQGVLRLWRKHFSTLLQGDDNTNTAA